MVRTLKKLGNTQALVIDKTMREQLGIDENTPLDVTIADGRLIVTPTNVGVGREEIEKHAEAIYAEYGTALKNLAKGPQ